VIIELHLADVRISRVILALLFHIPAAFSWISNETIWCPHFQFPSSLSALWLLWRPEWKAHALQYRNLTPSSFSFSFNEGFFSSFIPYSSKWKS